MSERLRKTIVFASLPLALIWAAFTYPSKRPRSHPPMAEAALVTETPAAAVALQSADKPSVTLDIDAKRRERWGDDPFRSRSRPSQTSSGQNNVSSLVWALAGIIYSEENPIAFVNNQMVGIGDRIGDATVTAINRESVTLEYQGRAITLKLRKG